MATREEIQAWADEITKKINASRHGCRRGEKLTVQFGKRYAKIVSNAYGTSVYCFVEIETGNILKAESWKAPAKHARGNIADKNGGWKTAVNEYGARYLT